MGWTIPLLCSAVVLILMKTVFLFGYVPTASMEPTLPAGSYILGLRIYNPPEKGDVIIFEHDGNTLIKRIFAVSGDIVEQSDGTVLIVPDDCYYVLGDNRRQSIDSRYWEDPFVKKEEVRAVLACTAQTAEMISRKKEYDAAKTELAIMDNILRVLGRKFRRPLFSIVNL